MSYFIFLLIDLLWINFFFFINWLFSIVIGVYLKGILVYKIYINVIFICEVWFFIVKIYGRFDFVCKLKKRKNYKLVKINI